MRLTSLWRCSAAAGEMDKTVAPKSKLLLFSILLFKLALFWLAGCALLWVTYGFDLQIDYGNLGRPDALAFTMKMSLIMSVLTGFVWAWRTRVMRNSHKAWAQITRTSLSTAAVLFLYVLIVLIRRNLWTAARGVSDYAQFLPIVGRVNSEFLSEFKWVIFVAEVLPIMSILSAILLTIGSPFIDGWPRDSRSSPN